MQVRSTHDSRWPFGVNVNVFFSVMEWRVVRVVPCLLLSVSWVWFPPHRGVKLRRWNGIYFIEMDVRHTSKKSLSLSLHQNELHVSWFSSPSHNTMIYSLSNVFFVVRALYTVVHQFRNVCQWRYRGACGSGGRGGCPLIRRLEVYECDRIAQKMAAL